MILDFNNYQFASIKDAIEYFKKNGNDEIKIKNACFFTTSGNLPHREKYLTDSQIKKLEDRINSVISFCNGESQADIAEEAGKDYLKNNLI